MAKHPPSKVVSAVGSATGASRHGGTPLTKQLEVAMVAAVTQASEEGRLLDADYVLELKAAARRRVFAELEP